MNDIDTTDYALLACIADADTPIWKKRLHDQLQGGDTALPGDANISLQTVSRRINTMHDQGLVDTKIVHPPDISQNLIIGYRLTEKGQYVLNEKRGDIISMYAAQADRDAAEDADRDTLLQLLDDELSLTAEERKTLEKCDMAALHVFALMYHTHRLVNAALDKQTAETFANIIERAAENNSSDSQTTYQYPDCHG